MGRQYHNLAGWLRDVRAAIRAGEQLAYEAAEAIIDLDELIDSGTDRSVDDVEDGAGSTDDGDGSSADGNAAVQPELGVEVPGVHRQPSRRMAAGLRSQRGPEEGPRDTGGVARAGARRTAVLSDGSVARDIRRRV